ncbi:unnamed protein product, partial [Aphanomyces euteiches]
VAEARAAAAEEEKERQAAVLAKRLHDADVVSQAQQQVLAGATRQYQEMAAQLAQAKVERENALYVATLSTSEVNRLNSEQNEANNRHAMESARQAQHVDFVTASATDAIQRQAEAAAAEVRRLENLSMLQNQELAELRERVHRFETIQQTAGPRDARRVPQHNRGAQDADGPGRTPQRQGTPTAQQPSFVTPAQVDDFDDGENDYFGEMEDDPNDNDSQTRQNGNGNDNPPAGNGAEARGSGGGDGGHGGVHQVNSNSRAPKMKNFKCTPFSGEEVYPGLGHDFESWHVTFQRAVTRDEVFEGSTWEEKHLFHALISCMSKDAERFVTQSETAWLNEAGNRYG